MLDRKCFWNFYFQRCYFPICDFCYSLEINLNVFSFREMCGKDMRNWVRYWSCFWPNQSIYQYEIPVSDLWGDATLMTLVRYLLWMCHCIPSSTPPFEHSAEEKVSPSILPLHLRFIPCIWSLSGQCQTYNAFISARNVLVPADLPSSRTIIPKHRFCPGNRPVVPIHRLCWYSRINDIILW